MPINETLSSERNEIAQELIGMLNFIQRLGHKPGYETHGETYKSIYDMNNSMYETRLKILKFIKNETR
jgi:hypothetical protein